MLKINQKIVMDEDLVQNGVMDGELVQNILMNAKIDPKVVMDLSIFQIGGWNSLQPINQILLQEFIDENEPWLLIGIPAIARSKARARCNATAHATRKFEQRLTPNLAIIFRAQKCAMMTERADVFQDPDCVGTVNCLILPRFSSRILHPRVQCS